MGRGWPWCGRMPADWTSMCALRRLTGTVPLSLAWLVPGSAHLVNARVGASRAPDLASGVARLPDPWPPPRTPVLAENLIRAG